MPKFNGGLSKFELMKQGPFCVCAQPMRGDFAIQRLLSLAGRVYKMIPEEIRTWVSDCIPQNSIDVITHPSPNISCPIGSRSGFSKCVK